jgi:arylsulfatase A-like enzyme
LQATEAREPGQRHLHAGHAAMSEDLDTGVGMTMDKIRELGIEDNTYVIYLADNGSFPLENPSNTNGPLHGWKATLWEGGIRVPFILAGPGIKKDQRRDLVVGYDLFPTISEWLGIGGLPAEVEGGSLAQLASGDPHAEVIRPHDFLVFHFPHYQLQKGSQPVTTLHQGNFKLIKFWETGDYHLYNLKKDLNESDNLARKDTNRTVRMSLLMDKYLASIKAGIPSVNTQYDPKTDPGAIHVHTKARLLKESYFVIE